MSEPPLLLSLGPSANAPLPAAGAAPERWLLLRAARTAKAAAALASRATAAAGPKPHPSAPSQFARKMHKRMLGVPVPAAAPQARRAAVEATGAAAQP